MAPPAFLFSNDPAHSRPWNPDWVTHRVSDLAKAAEVDRRAAAYLAQLTTRSAAENS